MCFSVQQSVLPDCVSRFVAEADFTYQDFSPRGVQAPPTMRAQVQYSYIYIYILTHNIKDLLNRIINRRHFFTEVYKLF